MPRSHDAGVARYNQPGPKSVGVYHYRAARPTRFSPFRSGMPMNNPSNLNNPNSADGIFRAVDVRIADAGAVGYRKLRPSANHHRNSSPGGTFAACGHNMVTSPRHRVHRTDRDSVSCLRHDAGGTRRLRRPPVRPSTGESSTGGIQHR